MYGLELISAMSKVDFVRTAHNLFNVLASSTTKYMFPAIFAFILTKRDEPNKKVLIEFIVLSFIAGMMIVCVPYCIYMELKFPADVVLMMLLIMYIVKPSGIRDAFKLTAMFIFGTFLERCLDFIFSFSAIKASALVEGAEDQSRLNIFIQLTRQVLEFLIICLVYSLKR